MVRVAVAALKTGERLEEEVRTALGNVLMEKGKVIGSREVEVLKAFLIKNVDVSFPNETQENEFSASATESAFLVNETAKLYEEYNKLFILLKKAFRVISAGTDQLPVLEIRQQLNELMKYFHYYNPLTFAPKRTHVNEYLIHNSILAGLTSFQIARWQGMDRKESIQIILAGLLHDIGTLRIDEAIVQKPSKLTETEFEELKKHTVIGYNILKNIAGINEGVKLAALQHHERLDGSGYPLGLKDVKIHPYAKLVAVADVFHAMTTSRQYKKASSPYLVLEELMKESFGKLEPTYVRTLITKVTEFQQGTVVRLNDGTVANIVFTDRNHPTRPMVNVNGTIINLATDRNRFIQSVISN